MPNLLQFLFGDNHFKGMALHYQKEKEKTKNG
jgi:hypothetical protein